MANDDDLTSRPGDTDGPWVPGEMDLAMTDEAENFTDPRWRALHILPSMSLRGRAGLDGPQPVWTEEPAEVGERLGLSRMLAVLVTSARVEAGLDQEGFADRWGLPLSVVQRLEKGQEELALRNESGPGSTP